MMNQKQGSGRVKLVNMLHIIMLSLSVIGTLVIWLYPSVTTKILISIILIAYTFAVLKKAAYIRNLFKITPSENQQSYQIVHKWQAKEVDEAKEKKIVKKADRTNFFVKKYGEKAQNNSSLNRSLQRSMQLKNMSMSICRSLNSSNLSQTRLSRLNQKEAKQPAGFDLSDLFQRDQKKRQESSLKKNKDTSIVLLDNQSYLHKNSSKFREQAEKDFERTLKSLANKDRKVLNKKYELLRQVIQQTVKLLLADNKVLKEKFIKLAQQYFECKIVENNQSISQSFNLASLKQNQVKRCSFYVFLYKIILLNAKRILITQLGFSLKKEISWNHADPKLTQLIKQLLKLSDTLGVEHSSIRGQLTQNIQKFIEDYRSNIQLATLYISQASSDGKASSKELSLQAEAAKSRAFALYLMVREMNSNLGYSPKIKFNDFLGFNYPKEDKIQFQINKKEGTEGPLIHYDLKVLDEGQQKLKYNCQPGQSNYLSVLYMLLLEFSKKKELLKSNRHINGFVRRIV